MPTGIGPIAIASRSISSPPALQRAGDAGAHPEPVVGGVRDRVDREGSDVAVDYLDPHAAEYGRRMELHVVEWGDPDAPPVVCLHGVTGHAGRFRQLAEERWAGRFHVFAPDLRGHGRSGWEPPWDVATHVADLVETVDALGIEQADWVGHSWGGRLVLELAAVHPERIRRAVLLDPAIQPLAGPVASTSPRRSSSGGV